MCNTFRPQKKQSKAYVERETEMEIDYFIKIEKPNVQNIAKSALFPQKIKIKKSEKNFKTRVTQNKKWIRKNTHHKLAVKSNASTPRNVNVEPAKYSQRPAQPEPLTLKIRITSR